MIRHAIIGAALYVLAAASPALAQRTFASFDLRPDAQSRTSNMQVNSSASGTSISGYSERTGTSSSTDFIGAYATNGTPLSQVGQVFFNFTSAPGLGRGVAANMFFKDTRSATPSADINNFLTPGFSGSIIFKPIESGTFANNRTYNQSSVLLAVNFQDGTLVRTRQTKSLGDSTGTPGEATYSANSVSFYSDFLNFGEGTPDRGFSTSFTGDRNTSGNSFIASLNGTFDNAAIPTETSPPVPEMSTWGMMIVGFGAIGSTLRRRRRAPVKAKLAIA